jgi:hypothetical protein
MSFRTHPVLYLMLLSAWFTACRSEPTPLLMPVQMASLPPQTMESVECPFDIAPGQEVVCGVIQVKDEEAAFIELVDLQVIIYKSKAEHPQPDPIIVLGFNPGASRFFISRGLFSSFLASRDIVLFSRQPLSEPGEEQDEVECPEITAAELDFLQQLHNRAGYVGELLQAYQTCHEKLVEANINLTGVPASQTAREVLAIRQALEIEQINLYGANYSTLAAIQAMELDPDSLRSVVMMSFYPPMAAVDLENSFNFALATALPGLRS